MASAGISVQDIVLTLGTSLLGGIQKLDQKGGAKCAAFSASIT